MTSTISAPRLSPHSGSGQAIDPEGQLSCHASIGAAAMCPSITVEATYKGRLYKGQLLIRDSLKSTDFFPISRVQIFALYKGQKLPQA